MFETKVMIFEKSNQPPPPGSGDPKDDPSSPPPPREKSQDPKDLAQQPKPLRFPWLNRLSAQLESAARQKPAFASAPQLGDNLDQAA